MRKIIIQRKSSHFEKGRKLIFSFKHFWQSDQSKLKITINFWAQICTFELNTTINLTIEEKDYNKLKFVLLSSTLFIWSKRISIMMIHLTFCNLNKLVDIFATKTISIVSSKTSLSNWNIRASSYLIFWVHFSIWLIFFSATTI